MLNTMPNVDRDYPFLVGEPVQSANQFWGRAKQVRFILEYVRNGQCISLVGPRGCGKTSLLNYVSDPGVCASHGLRPGSVLFVRLEGRELADYDQAACLGLFTERIIEQADEADAGLGEQLQDALGGRNRGHLGLRTLFRVLRDYGKQPVVALDDFDDLAQNARLEDSFFAALRSLATGCQVSYLVASLQPLYELETMRPEASTLCGICRQITLPPFSEQESRGLFLSLLEQARVTFPASIVDLILSWGRNEPWRLQLAGHEAFQVWQENGGKLRDSERAGLERRFENAAARWAAL
jgi:hypothetical protein